MTALVGAPVFIFIAARFLNENAVRRRRFPAFAQSCHLLRRPAALNIAGGAGHYAILLLAELWLDSAAASRCLLARLRGALFAPENVGDQSRFILFDIVLPGLLIALCGAMLELAGAAMQSIARNGLADPGLVGHVKGGQRGHYWR